VKNGRFLLTTITYITTEKGPRRFEPGDHGLAGLAETEPDKTMPGVAGSENERPAHFLAARGGVGHQSHFAEVDLELAARLAVGHPQGAGAGRAANAEDLERIALQSPFGDNHSFAGQELGGLHCGEAIIDQPRLQLVMVGLEN
jgi:hypothetical protein